jgi:hypothetical protein
MLPYKDPLRLLIIYLKAARLRDRLAKEINSRERNNGEPRIFESSDYSKPQPSNL